MGKEIISEAIQKHANARGRLQSWLAEAETAHWDNAQILRDRYPSASFIGDDIVIFNIGGNKYRLETQISYNLSIVIIKWFGTHSEYSKKKF
ncbi:type II toxin-antitoxin system HigB family toxin [bacterium]|nr:type II toxin-antitoxin system HigB family toxin [bacterium]